MLLIRITDSGSVSTSGQDQESHCTMLLSPYGYRKEDTAGEKYSTSSFPSTILRHVSSAVAVR